MEPKTFEEYWDEALNKCSAEWSCKYIGEAKYRWCDNKIEIWAICKLDYFGNECEGHCTKYEKYQEKKPWYKRLFK